MFRVVSAQARAGLVAIVVLGGIATAALAGDAGKAPFATSGAASPQSHNAAKPSAKPSPWAPRISVPKLDFQESDRTAALEAIQFALVEVSDGSTFVWHRPHSSLSGRVSPTETFRDTDGRICRHLKFRLSARTLTKQIEGIACRDGDGMWALNG